MDSFEEKFPWNFMPYHQGYPMPGAMMPVESPMVPWMGMAGGYPVYPANMYPQAYLDEMQNERDMKKMKELLDYIYLILECLHIKAKLIKQIFLLKIKEILYQVSFMKTM